MATLTIGSIAKMGLELFLGIVIKLFCDNGRVSWDDFANDFLFWIPGMKREAGDGLTRQIAAMQGQRTTPEVVATSDLLAAK